MDIAEVKFCSQCGTKVEQKVPDGDNRERAVCPACGHINYVNPRVVVGSVCIYDGKVLLGRRDIEPRKGYWTIPAGFMELGETTAEGAQREAWEEVRAKIDIIDLLAVFNISHVGQVQIIYLSSLKGGEYAVGDETSEANLFTFEEAFKLDLAFPNVLDALMQARKYLNRPPAYGKSVLQKDFTSKT